MHYRLYQPGDFAPLYAIEEACFQPPLRFPRLYMRSLVESSSAATWIAEQDGRMTGFAIVEWSRECDETVAYIQTLEISPEARQRGIGTELLRRLESSARSAGADLIWLHVDAENVTAIHLYESHGYGYESREENYYPNRRPALIYAKQMEARA
jgi:ribosomal protein S18 acetylase RimI-like enzyme